MSCPHIHVPGISESSLPFIHIINLSAIDLLEKMLDLDPDTRITATAALSHPYLSQYSDPTDEPVSEPYDQSFEEQDMDIESWKSEFFCSICLESLKNEG